MLWMVLLLLLLHLLWPLWWWACCANNIPAARGPKWLQLLLRGMRSTLPRPAIWSLHKGLLLLHPGYRRCPRCVRMQQVTGTEAPAQV